MTDTAEQKTDGFLRGQEDCKSGEPHKLGMGKDYDRGYGFQYELEQINTERSLATENRQWT